MPVLAVLGVELFSDWHAKFYFPGLIAIVVALFAFLMLKDRPESLGLPSIEDWRKDVITSYSIHYTKLYEGRFLPG